MPQLPTDRAARILAHTARMQLSSAAYAAENKEAPHPRAEEYGKQLKRYRFEWDTIHEEARAAATDAVADMQDLTPELIAAARAALEA